MNEMTMQLFAQCMMNLGAHWLHISETLVKLQSYCRIVSTVEADCEGRVF
jgi:hypothetical protein